MPRERQVYLLDPKTLGPETIAVTFAKTSRSPQSFREIAAELTDEKSAQFNERWVVGYGHSSVAEHAVLHIAVENVSRLAVECLQSNRLASYTEKSTRYQKWAGEDFFIPQEFSDAKTGKRYQKTIHDLFTAYQKSTQILYEHIRSNISKSNDSLQNSSDNLIRSMAVDASRFLLPAAALTNVGMTINARELEHAICKMLSHNLAEVWQVGVEIKRIAQDSIPTLVKYAHPVESLSDSCQDLPAIQIEKTYTFQSGAGCKLVNFDPHGEENILAAILYRYGSMSFDQCLQFIRSASDSEKRKIVRRVMGTLGEHDQPIRELEYAAFTFDITLDQGAYYELKRHRMMTQTVQQLTSRLGFATPKIIADAGLNSEYQTVMRSAAEVFEELAEVNPWAAAYVVPNGFYRQVLVQLNLREAFAFLSLRSASNAHFSLRLLAQQMASEIAGVCPYFAPYIQINQSESIKQIQHKYFL